MTNETIELEPSGRVLPIFRGEYDAGRTYENPDIVLYRNSSYVAKQVTVGNPPPADALADDYWQMVAKGIIDANISESTIEFTEASERSNIKSGEKSNVIMGKIMKFFTDLKDIAFSGSYADLSNKPTIPAAAKNGKLTIQKNGVNVQTFTANQSTNATANILVPTISNSATVTQTGQMALDAVEKNASVAGTLANQIQQTNSNLTNYEKIIVENLTFEADETRNVLFEIQNFPSSSTIVSVTIEYPNTYVLTSIRNVVGGRFNVNFHNFHWETTPPTTAIAHVLYAEKKV